MFNVSTNDFDPENFDRFWEWWLNITPSGFRLITPRLLKIGICNLPEALKSEIFINYISIIKFNSGKYLVDFDAKQLVVLKKCMWKFSEADRGLNDFEYAVEVIDEILSQTFDSGTQGSQR